MADSRTASSAATSRPSGSIRAWPAAVGRTPCLLRVSRTTSSSSSSNAICCPMVGWLTPHRAAAARSDPVSIAARKYRARSTRTGPL
ncbi:hypothetical protein LUW76_14200 [Actinomadura madurae]|nr:hypothetical protein [Actinomadura madurae]URM95375.1 hypothetical protein LUW76_14200 [Actinomadura madurae]